MGKPYILRINHSKTQRIDLINDLMMVSISEKQDVRKFILKWRKEQAEVILSEILYQCYLKFENELLSFPKLEIKYSKRQLGACFYKSNKIMLNLSLTVLPLHLIEYVVFHELNHFVYPNHSKEYHQNLKKYIARQKVITNVKVIKNIAISIGKSTEHYRREDLAKKEGYKALALSDHDTIQGFKRFKTAWKYRSF